MKPDRTFHHQNLSWARLRRGLHQAELANLIGVSTRSIKGYEGATYAPALEPLRRLAKVLKFPEGFFFADTIGDIKQEAVSFRAGSNLPARVRDMALGSAAVAIAFNREAERYFALPEEKLPDYSGRNPERAAELLRGRWDLGAQPIAALLPLLEEKGIRIFSLPSDVSNAGTFSLWHGRTPFIFLKSGQSLEATRADLAYELGHLVLHRSGEPASKLAHEEARNLAEAFMLPAGVMRELNDFSDLTQLLQSVAHFGVTPMLVVRRLRRAGVLSEWKFRERRMALTQLAGTDTHVGAAWPETSTALTRIFSSLRARGITKHKFAHVLGIHPKELDDLTFSVATKIGDQVDTTEIGAHELRPGLRLVSQHAEKE